MGRADNRDDLVDRILLMAMIHIKTVVEPHRSDCPCLRYTADCVCIGNIAPDAWLGSIMIQLNKGSVSKALGPIWSQSIWRFVQDPTIKVITWMGQY